MTFPASTHSSGCVLTASTVLQVVGNVPKVLPAVMFAIIAEFLSLLTGWGEESEGRLGSCGWNKEQLFMDSEAVTCWIQEQLASSCFTNLSCGSVGTMCPAGTLHCVPAPGCAGSPWTGDIGTLLEKRSSQIVLNHCEYFVVMTVAPHTTPLQSLPNVTRSC